MTQFKVGDIVEAFGLRGTVIGIYKNPNSLKVLFDLGRNTAFFTMEGKLLDWHGTPSLKFIEHPKKRVTKTMNTWCNIYPNNRQYLHDTKEEADKAKGPGVITCVKLSGTYEVEE